MSQNEHTRRHMSRAAKAILILVLICFGSGAGVSVLYYVIKGEIDQKAHEVFRESLALVLGEAPQYPAVGDYPAETLAQEKVYVHRTAGGALYAATGTARGYAGEIIVLVSVDGKPDAPVGADPIVHAMAILQSQETPGLGENLKAVEKGPSIWARIAGAGAQAPRRPWFQEQFSGKRLSELTVVRRGESRAPAAVTSPSTAGSGSTEGEKKPAAVTSPSPAAEAPPQAPSSVAGVTSPSVAATPSAGGAGGIVAVTGASVSSRGATEATRRAVEKVIKRTAEVYGR